MSTSIPDLGPLTDRTFAAVMMDLDGTLIDSTDAVMRSWLSWAQAEGVAEADMLAGHHHGVPAAAIIAGLLPTERRSAAMERIADIEIRDTDGIRVLPGAQRTLEAVGDVGAIVTSCTRPLAEARIGAAHLPPVKVLVTVDDTTIGKPAPEPYLSAARQLGVDPTRCLVVEDAPLGLRSGRAAGCALLTLTTTHDEAELDRDGIIVDLDQVTWSTSQDGVRLALR